MILIPRRSFDHQLLELVQHLDPSLSADGSGNHLGPIPHVGGLFEPLLFRKSMHVRLEGKENEIVSPANAWMIDCTTRSYSSSLHAPLHGHMATPS